MTNPSKEEIEKAAGKYLELKEKAKTGKAKDRLRFEAYKNIFANKLRYIVEYHTKRYRKFSNHADLEQDAFEALFNSLDSFNSSKGSFVWWVNRYVKTRVSRRANAHSTIKFPIKVAQDIKPYKISTIPVRADANPTPFDEAERSERLKNLENIIENLPNNQRLVVSMKYGFLGIRERPVKKILEDMQISRQKYSKLLSEAEEKIKRHLLRVER